MLLSEKVLKNIIKTVLLEYIYPTGKYGKGKGDFQKAAEDGLSINGQFIDPNGER